MRHAFEHQAEFVHAFKQSTELLLNTLNPVLITRLEKEEYPICDQYDNCTVTLIEISFSEEVEGADSLNALHEIFCVSIVEI